uniref:Uncharacterized protein n=1 Tax=Clytia hemisphaerica TaxID=252671 RepID=A0A7M5UUX9_9CNID
MESDGEEESTPKKSKAAERIPEDKDDTKIENKQKKEKQQKKPMAASSAVKQQKKEIQKSAAKAHIDFAKEVLQIAGEKFSQETINKQKTMKKQIMIIFHIRTMKTLSLQPQDPHLLALRLYPHKKMFVTAVQSD